MLQTSLLLTKSLYKIKTAAGISAVWRRQNVSPYFTIVQITFHFLWFPLAHCGIFENGVLLMYTLEGVSSVANFIMAYEESQ